MIANVADYANGCDDLVGNDEDKLLAAILKDAFLTRFTKGWVSILPKMLDGILVPVLGELC